jgi:hypothetical protein
MVWIRAVKLPAGVPSAWVAWPFSARPATPREVPGRAGRVSRPPLRLPPRANRTDPQSLLLGPPLAAPRATGAGTRAAAMVDATKTALDTPGGPTAPVAVGGAVYDLSQRSGGRRRGCPARPQPGPPSSLCHCVGSTRSGGAQSDNEQILDLRDGGLRRTDVSREVVGEASKKVICLPKIAP